MSTIKNKNYKKSTIYSGIFLVFAAALGLMSIINTNILALHAESGYPIFTIESSVKSNWWTEGNRSPRSQVNEDYLGDLTDLPLADISLHRRQSDSVSDCFVSYSYFDTKVDIDTAVKNTLAETTKGHESINVKEITSAVQNVSVYGEEKSYTLYQYELSGPGTDSLMKGIEFGFLNIDDGHIEVKGNCNEANQLPDTIEGLQLVKLTKGI